MVPREEEVVDLVAVRARVAESFGRQGMMTTLGAELAHVAHGRVDIRMPYSAAFTQQDGFLHAAAVAAIADSACGYAALTVMRPGANVLTIEFKTNLLSPAGGASFVARGKVVRAGKTIVVATAEVFARAASGEGEKLIATMMATMIAVEPPSGQQLNPR